MAFPHSLRFPSPEFPLRTFLRQLPARILVVFVLISTIKCIYDIVMRPAVAVA